MSLRLTLKLEAWLCRYATLHAIYNLVNNTSLQTNKEVNMDDSDSDIEEIIMEQRPKGASAPSNKSHVDTNALSTVCSKVFPDWDWTSNAKLCNKGCRIIVGWDVQVVDLLVLAQMDQVLHTKDLDLHKNMVRGQPWVLMGDFNAALDLEDIFFGSSVMNASMIEFKDCVANIEVVDINASGLHYTWNQKPRGGKGILKKLDRCMGNMEFIDEYVGAYAIYHPYRNSDHAPVVLKMPNVDTKKPRPFNFFNFLTTKSMFRDVVLQQWSMLVEGHSMYQLVTKLKAL
ncbi:RNA-directed DNA polymerase, eukaryota, reverse transcriptase zinc-binding domain protein, partial [Tanacetum coccineum]